MIPQTAPTVTRLDVWRIDARDGDTETVEGVEYRFADRLARRAVRFIEKYLVHSEGAFAGKPFILEPWERLMVRRLFGWLRPDGTRRYRTCFLFVPRKNGKSMLAAAIALYLLVADNEPGAQVYSAAADKEQAAIVFGYAKSMIEKSPELSRGTKSFRRSVLHPNSASRYVVLSSDAGTKHGLSTHGAIIDELHAHETRELFDVLTTSMGVRRQPLTLITTTAGYDRNSVCWEQYRYASFVNQGIVTDPTYLPVLFELQPGQDWNEERTWVACNPNLGVTIGWEFLRQEYRKAKAIPGFENTFRRMYLNEWTEQATRWLPMDEWRRCHGPPRDIAWWKALSGRQCYVGIDVSSTTDLTAMVAVFPNEARTWFDVVPRFWIPGKNVESLSRSHGVDYRSWIRQGWIDETDGSSTDQGAVVLALKAWASQYRVVEVPVDRWEGTRLTQDITDVGLTAFVHGQGFREMSGPSKWLERFVLDHRLGHGSHPILDWNAANAVTITDPAGNIKPTKDPKHTKGRIDGVVALIMALGRAMLHAPSKRSAYDRPDKDLMVF